MGTTRNTPFKPSHSSKGRFWGVSRIYGAEGDHETPYMTRIWIGRLRLHFFHRGDQDPDCHDHPWDFWTFPLRSYVEEVLTPIRETVPEGTEPRPTRYQRRLEVVKAFRFHFRPAEHRHRVIGPWDSSFPGFVTRGYEYSVVARGADPRTGLIPSIGTGTIPTIVWRGKLRRDWGFTKQERLSWCWVPWRKYVYEGGKEAPCIEIWDEE